MRCGLILTWALVLGACSGDTQLVVDLVTDFAPREEFTSVRIEQLGLRGAVRHAETVPAMPGADYGGEGVRVAQLALPPGDHTVRVSLIDRTGRAITGRSLHVQLEASTVVTALLPRSCLHLACPTPGGDPSLTECAGDHCVAPRCSPENPSACPTPTCTVDSDCVASVSCAVARCREGACLDRDEGACGAGRWCSPEGCVEITPEPDAGPLGTDGGGPCVPRTCAALGYECGAPIECGAPLDCGGCSGADTCGGGGVAYRCGNGDVTGPTVAITSGPDDPTQSTSATFTFAADDGPGVGVDRTECRIDGAAWSDCVSGFARSGLAEGARTFEVRAYDRAGNRGAIETWTWTVDHTPPVVVIDPIADRAPSTYDATVSIPFTYACTDGVTGCVASTRSCDVDGDAFACEWLSGTFDAGRTGVARFGTSVLWIEVRDAAGNVGIGTRMFTVTRCAGDMQYPSRSSSFVRGACCSGLVDSSSWFHPSLSFWHARGDGSCRPMSDYVARTFEIAWTGGGCAVGTTTQSWGAGCTSTAGRYVCTTDLAQAQRYCGSDGGSGTQTPLHGRAGEGWHPAPSEGCQGGARISNTLLMRRHGADDACWNSVDLANDRGSIASSELCKAPFTRFCRTNPVDASVACVCASTDPYASDGRR